VGLSKLVFERLAIVGVQNPEFLPNRRFACSNLQIFKELTGFEHSQGFKRYITARKRQAKKSYDRCLPFNRVESFTDKIYTKLYTLGGPQVDNQNMIFFVIDHIGQPISQAQHFLSAETALKDGKL
jgi:hypothetical protein